MMAITEFDPEQVRVPAIGGRRPLATHETAILYFAGAIVVAILLVAALLFLRNRKTNRLRAQFGPEYDHAVEQSGRSKAESGLRAAEKRVDKLTLRPPTATERDFYLASWAKISGEIRGRSGYRGDGGGSVARARHVHLRLSVG